MRYLCFLVLLTVLLESTCKARWGSAQFDGPKGFDPPAEFWHAACASFVRAEDVILDKEWAARELEITDKQAILIEESWRRILRGAEAKGNLDSETIYAAKEAILGQVLNSRQCRRFWQIRAQLEGPRALMHGTFSAKLGLSNRQREQIISLVNKNAEEHRKYEGSIFSHRGDLDIESPKILASLLGIADREDREILANLQPEQLAVWTSIISEKWRSPSSSLNFSSPSVSPDGGTLLFEVSWLDLHSMIVAFDLKTSVSRTLTKYDSWSLFPKMSPNGAKIVFSSSEKGTFDLYIMNSDGSDHRRLTEGELVADEGASFSPDASRLVFGTRSSGIFIMNVNGKERTVLSNTGHRPVFSSDGRCVIFQQTPSSRISSVAPGNIWIMNLDGSNCRMFPHRGIETAWSPDGNTIAFVGNLENPGRREIYTASLDGSKLKQLTKTGGYKGGLCFSSGGDKLFFWYSPSNGSPEGRGLNSLELETLAIKRIRPE